MLGPSDRNTGLKKKWEVWETKGMRLVSKGRGHLERGTSLDGCTMWERKVPGSVHA